MLTKNPGCIKIFLSYKMVYNEIPRPLHPWPMGLSFSLLWSPSVLFDTTIQYS
jgi:hypothetical protein